MTNLDNTLARNHSKRLVCSGAAICLWWITCLVGCGEPALKRYPLDGTVTLDGKPVENCTIIFTPDGKGLVAAASVSAGQFSFSEVDGPTTGEFSVRINPNEAEVEDVDPGNLAQSNRRPRIPKNYQDGSTLNAIISGKPAQSIHFELTSSGN